MEKEISKLEKKNKSIGDRKERIAELKQSLVDINNMSLSLVTEYRYASASDPNNPAGLNKPITAVTGQTANGGDIVTMFVPDGDMAREIHETRHAGLRFTDIDHKGIKEELSAYKAQYSWDGSWTYSPFVEYSKLSKEDVVHVGDPAYFSRTINNINQITSNVILSVVDNPGPNQKSIYPPPGTSLEHYLNN